ncbi:MAG: hypothetical protein VB130_06755 [Clostridium sp.]|nr:hypothetical protein [Clostridium sp.]
MDMEILEILKAMQSDMKAMQSDIKQINQRVERVDEKTDKNTLLLEDLNKKVQIVGEVQSALTEQLDRSKDKDGKSIIDRFNVIELAVTDTSSRVRDIQKDLTRVIRATGENWAEIAELKAVK